MRITTAFCYVAIAVLAFAASGVEGRTRLSREDVIENHNRRRAQIAKMIDDAKAALEDHESGVRRLEDEEHAKTTKRLDLYQRKLDSMGETLDERDIERMLQREKMRAERFENREL